MLAGHLARSLASPLARQLVAQQSGRPFDWDILRDGMTPRRGSVAFTRASTGTFLNPANGLISTAAINAARIESDGLLIEPARTNFWGFSEDLGNAQWNGFNLTGSLNTALSPSGTMTADYQAANGVNGVHAFAPFYALSSGVVVAGSHYAKKYTGTGLRYTFVSMVTGANNKTRFICYIDLQTGICVETRTLATDGVPSNTSFKIESVGDYWRISATIATNITGSLYHVFGLGKDAAPTWSADFSDPTFAGNSVDGIHVWGGQFEIVGAGGQSSSYIPTTSGVVTRSADVCTLNIPSTVASLGITYGDNTTATVSVTPGGTYQLPASQKKYKSIIAL